MFILLDIIIVYNTYSVKVEEEKKNQKKKPPFLFFSFLLNYRYTYAYLSFFSSLKKIYLYLCRYKL